jgi:hypothetical protein
MLNYDRARISLIRPSTKMKRWNRYSGKYFGRKIRRG